MNLNKMFVSIFVFFGFFTVLLVTMPTEFQELGVESQIQDKEVAAFFNAQNVTMYNYTLPINLTYGEAQSFSFGLPEGQKLEFWWDLEWYYGMGDIKMLELRHLSWSWWWWAYHELHVLEPFSNLVFDSEVGLRKSDLLALWDEDANASYCEFGCDHLNVKLFILTYDQSWTLEESWDNGKLKLFTSYQIDWTKTGTNMWAILMQLLTFQNPQLGFPGVGGTILSVGVGLALWGSIAVLAFAFITAVIPFISGWRGH